MHWQFLNNWQYQNLFPNPTNHAFLNYSKSISELYKMPKESASKEPSRGNSKNFKGMGTGFHKNLVLFACGNRLHIYVNLPVHEQQQQPLATCVYHSSFFIFLFLCRACCFPVPLGSTHARICSKHLTLQEGRGGGRGRRKSISQRRQVHFFLGLHIQFARRNSLTHWPNR